MRGTSTRNKIASFLAMISGALLIASGTTGVNVLQKLQDATLAILDIPVVQKMFVLVMILASLGGTTVIIGGLLIKKDLVRTGKIFIWVGSGVGLISMMEILFTTVSTDGITLAGLFSLASSGVLLAFIAQIVAKSN